MELILVAFRDDILGASRYLEAHRFDAAARAMNQVSSSLLKQLRPYEKQKQAVDASYQSVADMFRQLTAEVNDRASSLARSELPPLGKGIKSCEVLCPLFLSDLSICCVVHHVTCGETERFVRAFGIEFLHPFSLCVCVSQKSLTRFACGWSTRAVCVMPKIFADG